MGDTYTKVPHTEYLNLIKKCETLEKENAMLKADLQKATEKATIVEKEKVVEKIVETKTETKKGGNK